MWTLLVVCIAVNVSLAVIFKWFGQSKIHTFNAIIINYFVCVIVSSIFLGEISVPIDAYQKDWFWIAGVLSFLFIVGFNVLGLSFQKSGLTITTVVQKMSLILPTSFAIIFFNERFGVWLVPGIIAALAAIILVNYKPQDPGLKKLNVKLITLPILVFLLSGIIEILLYVSEATGSVTNDSPKFIATAFLMAGCLGLIYQLIKGDLHISKKTWLGGVVLGMPNYFSIYLIVALLEQGWDGAQLFPILNIGILLATSIVGIIFYREKLTPIKALGMLLGIIAIILVNIN